MMMTQKKTPKLGERQESCLRLLAVRGDWPGTGWVWDNDSGTARILDSLVKHGLVAYEADGSRWGRYTITDAGRELVAR